MTVNVRELLQQVADGTLPLAEARARLRASLGDYCGTVNDRLCELVAKQMNEIGQLKRLPSYELLEEIEKYLDGSIERQIKVLEREKEDQVCAQNFDAASEIREQQKELQQEWSREAMLRRVRVALGKDP